MRLKRILAAAAAAVMTVTLAPALTTPVQAATTEEARSTWRTYALNQLAEMEAQRPLVGCKDASGNFLPSNEGAVQTPCMVRGFLAWTNAYQAKLTAFREGGNWNHADVVANLQATLAEKKADGGYGLNYERPSKDGTLLPVGTTYTVTTADHVGPILLEAYQNGSSAVSASDIQDAVDSLMGTPVFQNTGTEADGTPAPAGLCMSYSTHSEDLNRCSFNVTIGAANFLQKAVNAGFGDATVQARVDSLKQAVANAYEKPADDYAIGFWPYTWVSPGNNSGEATGYTSLSPHDWNHNAYTGESAVEVGMAEGDLALNRMAQKVDYHVQQAELTSFDAVGRLRAASKRPNMNPRNTYQDALFFSQSTGATGDTAIMSHAQAGMWAARLAENAHATSVDPAPITSIANIKVFVGQTEYTGTEPTVPSGSKIRIEARVRTSDGLGWYVVNKPIVLRSNGVAVATKSTGMYDDFPGAATGNIAFFGEPELQLTARRCFTLRAKTPDGTATELDSAMKCVNVS